MDEIGEEDLQNLQIQEEINFMTEQPLQRRDEVRDQLNDLYADPDDQGVQWDMPLLLSEDEEEDFMDEGNIFSPHHEELYLHWPM